jgi:hypothetical protein
VLYTDGVSAIPGTGRLYTCKHAWHGRCAVLGKIDHSAASQADSSINSALTLTYIALFAVYGILIVKSVPVLKTINKMGAFRSATIMVASVFLWNVFWNIFLQPIFNAVVTGTRMG